MKLSGGIVIKWYKHISDSLDDPFIMELIDEFKSDGYLVFFGTIEMMAREFDTENPGIVTLKRNFIRRKLRLSWHKISTIYTFCEENERFFVQDDGHKVTINCPKLKEMCDDWTQRLLRSNSEATPKKPHTEEEVEVEEEEDKEIKESPPKADLPEKILKIKDLPEKHSDVLKDKRKEIERKGLIDFAARCWEFIGYALKKRIDFEQIELSFSALLKSDLDNETGDCWAYCWQICDSQQKEVNLQRNQNRLDNVKKEGGATLLKAVIAGEFNKKGMK